MKKIKARSEPYAGIEPVSIYHVEYEPQIVMRGTTGYPNLKKEKLVQKSKLLVIKINSKRQNQS